MAYNPRTSKPEKGNKYYNTKSNGGYSDAIVGKPTDKDCNVLSNCVGYAYGRFNEIGQYGKMKYLAPVNAENFWDYCSGCQKGQKPKLGACMVWQKGPTRKPSDGAGHVCIVEKIISDTEVVTSESGWNNPTPWYSKNRKKGSNGRWGQDSNYTFLGFIYNPAVPESDQPVDYEAKTKEFQNWLNSYGYDLAIDGRYGKQTKKTAVKVLQTELNKQYGEHLVIDGGFGKLTKAALQRHVIKKGDKGNLVKVVQGCLYGNKYDPKGFDGSFGSGCDLTVKNFQLANKLNPDGRVGQDTFGKLI